jgi:cyclic 2,3-diphosphoglycerate synthetase
MRVIALVDGEHYPPVTRWGIDVARSRGLDVVAALFLGGGEKLTGGGLDLGIEVRDGARDPAAALARAIRDLRLGGVLDLSDEPVLRPSDRHLLASVALAHGAAYLGGGMRLDPPVTEAPLAVPTLAVIGTGKRTGKTAIAGALGRLAIELGEKPAIVAMGRGGPAEPEVAGAGALDAAALLSLADAGAHAASDYLEDAVTSGATTVGARRVGGGLAGAPYASTVPEAADRAVEAGAGLVILEGSGAAVPPVPWDAGVLVVPAGTPPERLTGDLGAYRLLLSDLLVLTMTASPQAGLENLSALRSHVQRIRGDTRLIVTDFEPVPLGDVQGRDAFFATTAPKATAERQVTSLEERFGCRVVGWSARLADRAGLARDMEKVEGFDVLLTELKAAAVDVAARRADRLGVPVVFVDNRPVSRDGQDVDGAFADAIALAKARRKAR